MKCKRRSSLLPISMATPHSPPPPSPFTHPDILADILSRLPAKSIKRFESVSKLWYALLTSPAFIAAHLRRSSRCPALLIHRFHNPTASSFTISLVDSRTGIPCDIKIPFLSSLIRFPKIVGSSNGILCLDVSPCYATRFVLWNLSTGEFRFLPSPLIDGSRRPIWMVATGFGYSLDAEDYKLVRVVSFECESDESLVVRAEVFSLITGTWRLIDDEMTDDRVGNCVAHEGQRAVQIGESLCWIANRFDDVAIRKSLVRFDLATEEFRQILIPECPAGVSCKVISLKESIALAVYAGLARPVNRIEIWVWEENDSADGVAIGKNWVKVHTVEINFAGIPVGVYNETELIIKRVDLNCVSLAFYDTFTQCFNNIPICSSDYTCEFFSYVDSLVPITGEGDGHIELEEDEEEEAEVKE